MLITARKRTQAFAGSDDAMGRPDAVAASPHSKGQAAPPGARRTALGEPKTSAATANLDVFKTSDCRLPIGEYLIRSSHSAIASPKSSFSHLPLADLVVIAGFPHPFPFRTRP